MPLSLRLPFVLLLGLATASSAEAQWREGFESPDPTWSLSGADGGVRVLSHRREFEAAHAGVGLEHLRVIAGRGTHIYYSMPIDRSPIVEESGVSLWVKGDRTPFQLLVRVVFPRSLDDRTGKPITTLLRGDEYLEVGSWQQLRIAGLPKLLNRDLVVLRRQFGPQVDPREAYIDLIVLNTYSGPGETNVWIDDLEVTGVLDPDWAKTSIPSTTMKEASAQGRAAPVVDRPLVLDGNVTLLQGRPQFVRAIEDRGESWELLRSLGFNTIWMATAPTPHQQEEAKKLGLWMIAPPPDVADDPAGAAKLENVIAWLLGRNLGVEELNPLRKIGREIRGADRTLRRPLVCGPRAETWNFSRETDLLLFEAPALFSSAEFEDATLTLRSRTQQARSGTPHWVTLQLEPARELLEQLRLFDPAGNSQPTADLTQARLATYAALRSGARGLLFRSSVRLDGNDEIAAQRQAIFRLLNQELKLFEPWLAGSTAPQDLPTGDPTLQATLWQTERARLMLLSRTASQSQYCTAPVANDSMTFPLPGVPAADRVFHLTADGLKSLQGPQGGTGMKIVVPEAGGVAAVAITQNSLVIQHLAKLSEEQRREGVETRLRMAANDLTSTALTVEQITGTFRAPPQAAAYLRESQNLLGQADRLLVAGDLTSCYRHVRRVESHLVQVRRQWWEVVRATFPNSLASPCGVAFDTLPAQVNTTVRMQQSTWGRSGLPAGDFEQLEKLLSAGWKQHRQDAANLVTTVELSRVNPHGGTASLHLAVTASGEGSLAANVEPPVSITSGPLAARAGQIARVRGWARVPVTANGASAELVVSDNLTGPSLAERLRGSNEWREFTLYRAVPTTGSFQLIFALRGTGEAFLDDVTVEFCDLEPARNARRE